MRSGLVLALAGCLVGSIGGLLQASSPTYWEMTSYQDFIKGKLDGLSLSRDGRLTLAPKLDTVFASGQPVIWSIAQGADGTLYAGTGHRGRVYKVTATGQSSILWTSDQPEIFAVAVDAHGVVYAGTSPNGKIYRIEDGKATEYYAPPATKYIWSLTIGPDNALYAGTGDGGKIFRITGRNAGEEYYATGQSHVTGLTFDRQGHLLAGTEPNGILFRVSSQGKAFVLYGASLPEIRVVAQAQDGSVYAVGMGGSVNRRLQQMNQAAQGGAAAGGTPTFSTSITVTADAAGEVKPPEKPATPPAAAPTTPSVTATATTTPAAAVEINGLDKSAIYKIHTDNTVETLWSSKEENVYDLLPSGNQILFSTDSNGRIYRLSADRHLTLLLQTNESATTRLLQSTGGVLAATGNLGRIYRLEQQTAATGSYESPVYDAGTIARWGRIRWTGDASGGGIAFRTRTGNSFRPDPTWSDWSGPVSAGATGGMDAQISSPNARYVQWKAELTRAGANTPTLDNVSIAYLPQNISPVVKSITAVMSLSQTAVKSTGTSSAGSSAAYSITVTDSGDAGPSTSTGTPTQTLSRAANQQLAISWQAEDPDGDRLVYTIYFRGEGERDWKQLKSNVHETSVTVDGDTLADGRYFFRVVASDRESNAADTAREAELISSPVLIDNTPPVITVASQEFKNGALDVVFSGADAASALRRCEYSLDAGAWQPMQSEDGVIDSLMERFHLHLENLSAGEHMLVLRVVDSGNNAGLKKLVLR